MYWTEKKITRNVRRALKSCVISIVSLYLCGSVHTHNMYVEGHVGTHVGVHVVNGALFATQPVISKVHIVRKRRQIQPLRSKTWVAQNLQGRLSCIG